jgi:hypothetical protein
MKTLAFAKVLGGAFGVLGISVLLGGTMSSAKAGAVSAGTDYLVTPSKGATYTFALPGGGSLPMEFVGLPIGSPTGTPNGGWGGFLPSSTAVIPGTTGLADTVVNRRDPVPDTTASSTNPITGLPDKGGSTIIEIVGLSLKSVQPITIASGLGIDPGPYEVYAGLQKYYGNTNGSGPESTGTMFIGEDLNNANLNPRLPVKTWDSEFTINGVAFLAPVGTANPDDFVRKTLQEINTAYQSGLYACTSTTYAYVKGCYGFQANDLTALNEPWKESPVYGDLIGQNLIGTTNDFYLGTLEAGVNVDDVATHEAPNKLHIVKTPAPLPVLGAPVVYAFARRLRKRCRQAVAA